jgi:hypothetical protein
MTKIDVTKLAAIPFLNHAELPGRFLCSSLFYDGEWHAWIEVDDQMIKVQMWPAETLYFGTRAERKTDLCLRFLNLIAQRLADSIPIFREDEPDEPDTYDRFVQSGAKK